MPRVFTVLCNVTDVILKPTLNDQRAVCRFLYFMRINCVCQCLKYEFINDIISLVSQWVR